MRDLLAKWEGMSEDISRNYLLGMRLELSVRTEKIIDGRKLCSNLDLFEYSGIERAIRGHFDIREGSLQRFFQICHSHLAMLANEIHGRNSYAPFIRVKSALTFARQAIGWSGKHMERQLQQAREWRSAQASQQALIQVGQFLYDGWEQDDPNIRPLIFEFLHNAH
uniref:Uncharacterized protein n=1 Tax=Physcomitrium patens TaxID=3218 RepID=A0A2K1IWK5_PHYPA|nr:hypothetical protein PHYPA_023482 [Physcomitrium patens]